MSAADGPKKAIWQQHKQAADLAFKHNKYPEAAASYTKVIIALNDDREQRPAVADRAKVYANRSLACYKMADFKEALKDAQVAVGLDPRWQKGWYRLASALEGLGLHSEAIIALETGAPLNATNSEMQQLLKQVRKHLEEAPSSDDRSAEDLELQEEMQAFFQKHCKNATALKERGANSNVPEDTSAQQSAVKQGVQQAGVTKQQKKKRRQQKKAAQSESPSPSPERSSPTITGSVSDRASQSSAAQDQSTQQAAAEPTADLAIEVPPPAVDERPVEQQQAEAAKDLGNTQYKAAQYDAALQSYSKAIELCPETAAYYGNRAAAALMKRQYKLAVQDCLQATKLNGAFARGYQRAGKAYLCMGQLDEADSQYRRAMELEPGSAAFKAEAHLVDVVRNNLKQGRQCLEEGDARQAQWHADKAVRLHSPPVETALLLKVEALLALGKHAEALNEIRSLTVHGDPMATEVLTVRAQALYLSGNMSMAENTYQVVLRLDPDNSSSRKGLKRIKLMNSSKNAGNEAFKAGKWREAEQHYTQALEVDAHLKSSFVAQCACNRAAVHLKLRNPEAALKDAECAVELDPQYAKAFLRRASAHQALEHFEEAVKDFEQVKSLEDSTPNIDGMLRDAKVALKKSKRVDYYKLLEIDQNAGDADVKKAYRRAAFKYHPDKASSEDREENEKKFKLVGQAHAILSEPAKRQKYDAGWSAEEIDQGMQMGEDGTYGHGGGGHGANMDDVFAHMFAGGMFGGGMPGGMGGGGMPGGMGGGRGGGRPGYSRRPGGFSGF